MNTTASNEPSAKGRLSARPSTRPTDEGWTGDCQPPPSFLEHKLTQIDSHDIALGSPGYLSGDQPGTGTNVEDGAVGCNIQSGEQEVSPAAVLEQGEGLGRPFVVTGYAIE